MCVFFCVLVDFCKNECVVDDKLCEDVCQVVVDVGCEEKLILDDLFILDVNEFIVVFKCCIEDFDFC